MRNPRTVNLKVSSLSLSLTCGMLYKIMHELVSLNFNLLQDFFYAVYIHYKDTFTAFLAVVRLLLQPFSSQIFLLVVKRSSPDLEILFSCQIF